MWPEDPGSWADWVSGVGTTGALAFAIAVLLLERRSHRTELRRRQAQAINAWFASVDEGVYNDLRPQVAPKPLADRSVGHYVYISNASTGLVYNVVLDLSVLDQKAAVYNLQEVVVRVVPPGVHRVALRNAPEGGEATIAVSMLFRDAQGRFWNRDNFGDLTEDEAGQDEIEARKPFEYRRLESIST